jgi:hypothetical protein
MFNSIFGLDLFEDNHLIVAIVVCVFSAMIITFAYHNVALTEKATLLQKRHVSSGIKVPAGTDRRTFADNLRAQLLANTTAEATAFAVLFNNILFLLAVLVFSFYVFVSASTVTNFVVSVSLAASLASLGTATVLRK